MEENMRILIPLIMVITLHASDSFAEASLRSWAHHNQKDYEAGLTTDNAFAGKYSAYIRSKSSETNTTGTLWQAIKPRPDWFGEKVMLTVHMRTVKVKEAAGLFMRVSTYSGWINYDYMHGRVVRGDNDWHKYMVVLDIPFDTSLIDFGVWVVGKGEVQVDEFRFDVVDKKLHVTGASEKIEFGEPENLDFERYTE
jgi:hypothetical protein